jgi:hypothetical protein
MSEHEGALFDAVKVLAATLLELGADPEAMHKRLMAVRDATDALGNRSGASTLDFLIAALFPAPDAPDPAPKPTFRIV